MSDQSDFFYQRVQWKHDLDDQPVVLWAEINSDGFERRKVDEFADGTFGFAIKEGESGGTRLAIVPMPALEQINAQHEFEAAEVTQQQFDEVWERAQGTPRI